MKCLDDIVLGYAQDNGYTHLAYFSCFEDNSCGSVACGLMNGRGVDFYTSLDLWACNANGAYVFCGVCPFHEEVLCVESNQCKRDKCCDSALRVLGVKI